MPIKIFTTIDGPCPFGTGHAIDSPGCRKCENYYRQGTGTFFWCRHQPVEPSKAQPKKPKETPVVLSEDRPKRGRPRKAQPAKPKRKRQSLPKKGKERPIKTIKQVTK